VTDQTQLAGFGQISLQLNKRLTATAGVRVGRAHYQSVTEVPPAARAEDTDTSTTPRFGLTYQSDRYGLLYATAAKGYRNGGVYAPHLGCGDAPAPYLLTRYGAMRSRQNPGPTVHRLHVQAAHRWNQRKLAVLSS
jgi:outer membrane receptor protein involved in Fe transport